MIEGASAAMAVPHAMRAAMVTVRVFIFLVLLRTL
jgi:hypothetical protein